MKTLALGCMSLLVAFASAQPNLNIKLQACYDLDCPTGNLITNGATTGSALDGTVHGNVTCVAGHLGIPSTALKFGGTALDYVALPNSSLIRPTTSITIAGWFYVTNTNYETLVFTKNACQSILPGYTTSSNSGKFALTKYPPGCGTGTTVSSATTIMNTWHFVVAYADNSRLRISVDNGTPVTISHTLVFNYDPTTSVILGGTNLAGTNFPFTGQMDNIRFYNRELIPSEIATLYSFDPYCTDAGLPPVSDFNISSNIICDNESIVYVNQSANTSNAWNWEFEGGSPSTSTLISPSVNYNTPGVYTISLVASNNYGIGNKVTKTITVTTCAGASWHTKNEQYPEIFPNPTNGRFTLNRIPDCDVSISDVSGWLIDVVHSDSERLEMNYSNLRPGVYYVNVRHRVTGELKVLKLLVYGKP